METIQSLIIKNLHEGGAGSEAQITIQLRNSFPGIGGELKTEQAVVSALREPYSAPPDTGARLFLKHTILKKLDDFFIRTNQYFFQHITRPLGSITQNEKEKEGYLYEWVYGRETFSWEYPQGDGQNIAVQLEEWSAFVSAFDLAGIDVNSDITDPDNGLISQNIIHQLYRTKDNTLNLCWKRIDFGSNSLIIHEEKLKSFLDDRRQILIDVLGLDRYELMILACRFLYQKINERELGQLDMLAREYRISSLRHKIAEHIII
ncbi:MAG: hypothetical protein AAB564_01790 [Patescibacteria group bacterium]